jgi:hypothetical protein
VDILLEVVVDIQKVAVVDNLLEEVAVVDRTLEQPGIHPDNYMNLGTALYHTDYTLVASVAVQTTGTELKLKLHMAPAFLAHKLDKVLRAAELAELEPAPVEVASVEPLFSLLTTIKTFTRITAAKLKSDLERKLEKN